MSILVVGADHLGDIAVNLKSMGCKSLTHLKGRKNIHRRNLQIPEGTDLVLVMTDYVDHNIARFIRDSAKSRSIPVVFSKRSWTYLSPKLKTVKGLS
ncbi:MAG: DUF2325 domain-containing protein [Peptococcaceae bacterium]|nr:DUF2325 domain-containing protein [Peptococcaceae bacterium]